MNGLFNDIGEWLAGIVVLGAALLVINALLRLWHRLTKGRRQILSFVLICHADDASSWRGHGVPVGEGGVTLNIDDLLSNIFAGSKTVSVAELVKDRRASRESSMSLIPAGNRITSEQEAIGCAVAASRSSLSRSELSKSRAMVVQSVVSGRRSYVVMIGSFPGSAPRLVLGD
jgi:hypothetical protein